MFAQTSGQRLRRRAGRPDPAFRTTAVIYGRVQIGASRVGDELDVQARSIAPWQTLMRTRDLRRRSPGSLRYITHMLVRYTGALVEMNADDQVRNRSSRLVNRAAHGERAFVVTRSVGSSSRLFSFRDVRFDTAGCIWKWL
ncbi:hypothetical protein [Nocardia nova]